MEQRMQTCAAHSMYIHRACYRFQLGSPQAADSVPEVKKMFGTMGNILKLFFFSTKKADSQKSPVHSQATGA